MINAMVKPKAKTKPKTRAKACRLSWEEIRPGLWRSRDSTKILNDRFVAQQIGSRVRVRDLLHDDDISRDSLAKAAQWACRRARR